MKKYFCFIVAFCLAVSVFSQNRPSKGEIIFGDDFEEIMSDIEEQVGIFQRAVTDLAGNEFTYTEKQKIKQTALKLFIGDGEPFSYTNPYNVTEWDTVKMVIVKSKRTQSRDSTTMKAYLSSLTKSSRYRKVVIESSEAIRVDGFSKIGEGKYMATAHYLQKYSAFRGTEMNRAAYTDYTPKTVMIYINRIEIESSRGEEHYWEILLGDVDCEDDAW